MRRARFLRLAAVVAACVLVCAIPASAARSDAPDRAEGPRFVDYPTRPGGPPPRFDFARLDGAPAPQVRAIADAVAGMAPLAQLRAVNARVNRVPTRDDRENYGVDDYWATPAEFFRRGGDCEDYAIAKYAILERLGWPAAAMWIVVLRETVISPVHAVLMVRHAGRLLMLDNLADPVVEPSRIDWYRPAYSLNRFGTWSHGGALTLAGQRRASPTGR